MRRAFAEEAVVRGSAVRFTYGCPPTLTDFDPLQQGWRRVREPSPLALALLGSLLGVPMCGIVVWAWRLLDLELSLRLDLGFLGAWGRWAGLFLTLFGPPLVLLAIIAAHEFIHALGCPRWGLRRCTTITYRFCGSAAGR